MRRRTWGAIAAGFLCAAALFACGSRTGLLIDDAVFLDDPDASLLPDRRVRDTGRDVPIEALPLIDARPKEDVQRMDCPDADATLVYVVTSDFDIYSFYPADGTFKRIGRLICPSPPGSSPFSMAVDRKGKAYVVFSGGNNGMGGGAGEGLLYQVSTLTGACVQTSYVANQGGISKFGMGFASNDNGPDETLFIASGENRPGMGSAPSQLGRIDTATLTLDVIGPFLPPIKNAELTGTGDGRLFAFYALAKGSAIGQIDKLTGQVVAESPLLSVDQGTGWAFAFWGGDFYTFTAPATTSTVTRFRPSDNSITVVGSLNEKIVGAGVSTCAPEK